MKKTFLTQLYDLKTKFHYGFQMFCSPGIWLLVCLPLMGGCSWFFDNDNTGEKEEQTPGLLALPYKTVIKPASSKDAAAAVEDHLKALSLLIQLESRPPPSLNALYHRIQNDVTRLKQGLEEKGYFDGGIEFAVDKKATPVQVTLIYKTGKHYKISAIDVLPAQHLNESSPINPDKAAKSINLNEGDFVDLSHVEDSNLRLGKYLRNHGFPHGEMAEPEGEIDRDAKSLHIIFRTLPGKRGSYGKTDITGLKHLNPQFVRNRLEWEEGKSFDERELELTRRKLMGTGLFSSIDVDIDEGQSTDTEVVPLNVRLVEGPPRTIGAGVKYATTEGLGTQAFWSHKNFFGGGEGLGAGLRLSPLLSKIKADLDIPDVFAPEQHLRTEVSAIRERNKAYRSRSLDAGVRLEHPFTDSIKGVVGVTVEAGRVSREGTTYHNRLIGLPLEVQIDGSNDLIDPTKGGRASVQVTPYRGRSGNDRKLTIATAKGSYYLRLSKGDVAVMAGWIHTGTISTNSFDSIAPNKRFYAGGAGSVRAYGYKLLGPLDTNRVPLGGRSILEYGVEGRFRISETIGFVAFAEAGSVGAKASPDISSDGRLWGVGAGLRYYTSIGPLRFDIATPLKRRRPGGGKVVDSSYQFYVSLGQAF